MTDGGDCQPVMGDVGQLLPGEASGVENAGKRGRRCPDRVGERLLAAGERRARDARACAGGWDQGPVR
jgi:hypothetical protein